MLIQVTQDDIDQGVRAEIFSCPLARALRRQTGQTWKVFTRYILVHDDSTGKDGLCVELPDAAGRFVWDFDRHHVVKPFSFEVELDHAQEAADQPVSVPRALGD